MTAFLAEQGVAIATARAGNVIGGGDWSEDRLIPDAVRAWQTGQILEIRRPDAIRPWQHVLEPLAGYLTLAEKIWQQPDLAGAYNFGPETSETATVRDVVEIARHAYGRGKASYGDSSVGPHEAGWLALEIAKARQCLGVKPRWSLAEAIDHTMAWYSAQHEGADARVLCESQIAAYERLVMSRFTITDLPLAGLKLVERQRLGDSRGFLSRLFCAEELARRRLAEIRLPKSTIPIRPVVALFVACISSIRHMQK